MAMLPNSFYLWRSGLNQQLFPVELKVEAQLHRKLRKQKRPFADSSSSLEEILAQMPAWMSEASKAQLLETAENARLGAMPKWWANLTSLLDSPSSLEDGSLLIGMAAVLGMDKVVLDLIKAGASMEYATPPKRKNWKWPQSSTPSPRGALDYAVRAMLPACAVSQIDPRQLNIVNALLAAGADPKAISPQASQLVLRYPPLLKHMLSAGWSPISADPQASYEYVFDPSNTVSLSTKRQVLQILLDNGLPLYPRGTEAPSLIEVMTQTASGIRSIEVALAHFGPEAQAALTQGAPRMIKQARRMKDSGAVIARAQEVVLEHAVQGPASGARRRI